MKRSLQYFFVVAMVTIAIIFFLSGCAVTYRPSNEALSFFERYTVDRGYSYYISGAESHPNALMALDNRYQLSTKLWRRIDPTPEILKEYVQGIQRKVTDEGFVLHGFSILDDKGADIGKWYSVLFAPPAVRMVDDRTVIIYTPPLDLYERKIEKPDDAEPVR
ncbi:MAG: hypothetical protein JW884_01140 [Deltaproteobacteria bacterium]|nr:hypothetical protein [Deltaproteobacteria bacterium]